LNLLTQSSQNYFFKVNIYNLNKLGFQIYHRCSYNTLIVEIGKRIRIFMAAYIKFVILNQ